MKQKLKEVTICLVLFGLLYLLVQWWTNSSDWVWTIYG